MLEFRTVRELYETSLQGSEMEKEQIDFVELQGWVITNRFNGSIGFLELNDGTYFKNCQVVYDAKLENLEEISKLTTGSAVTVMGKFILTPENKQPYEVQAKTMTVEGLCANDYPLQKKRHG